jgi:M6 family metalloprotease-like protein
MLEQMALDGTLPTAMEFARALGTYEMQAPKRGAMSLDAYSPERLAELIAANLGRSLDDGRSTSAIGKSTSRELAWIELDLNHDRTVDERDLLALGHPRPKVTASLPSLGTNKMFCLIIDFPDYPYYFAAADFDDLLFGDGNPGTWYRGLHYYYDKASYSQQNIAGNVYGWYTAKNNRTYYHPNDNNSYPWDTARRHELIYEAVMSADAGGADFSDFDNDGDGVVDEFVVVWAGPHGNWSTFWWGYHTSWSSSPMVDGVTFGSYSWQWERYYSFTGDPPTGGTWDPKVVIHETGHAQGLPDWYDYDGGQGPDGGVGGLDMMDGNWGDHNSFSKYALGWLNPTVAFTNLDDEQLDKSHSIADAVTVMPGFDPVTPWSEFFMGQYRYKDGVDQTYPTSGLLLWHVDARVRPNGSFLYNNSYTDHKCLRLMEADGLEEIEAGGSADAGDFYQTGNELSPTSTPNSNDYDSADTGITVDDISAAGDNMTADFTLYTSNPPTVSIDAPTAGDTVSGDTTVTVSASDDGGVDHVQLLIDGVIVKEWSTWTSPQNYTWNTRVDFNGSCQLTARAWDGEDHAASNSISVTVSNTGATSISDNFESGLSDWRNIHVPEMNTGQYTAWSTRASPGSPAPLGSGDEAYVEPSGAADTWHIAYDNLRSQRLNATGYSRDLHLSFYYRCRSGLKLYATTNEGSTWTELDELASTSSWATFNRSFDLDGSNVYFELRYSGQVQENSDAVLGANIDNFSAQEAASNPPTVNITSHTSGDVVSGSATFVATASDDGSVAKVEFYLHGSLENTDNTAPWEYTRNTLNDDNHPAIELMVIAYDNDGIPSAPDAETLIWKNQRPFPVSDDLESGDDDWSYYTSDSADPDWSISTVEARSGTKSVGWYDGGSFDPSNSDGAYYWGDEPASGRQCIDLAHPSVLNPVLRYYCKGDVPTTAYSWVYLSNTWEGSMSIASWLSDEASWSKREFSLAPFKGYSGRILWWVWSGSDTSGTGLWIDDVEVTNSGPTISSITPVRGVVGTELTIKGYYFGTTQGTSAVTFGGGVEAEAGDIVSWSDTEIHVDIPTDAQSGDVYVTVDSLNSNGVNVSVVLAAPALDSLEQLGG